MNIPTIRVLTAKVVPAERELRLHRTEIRANLTVTVGITHRQRVKVDIRKDTLSVSKEVSVPLILIGRQRGMQQGREQSLAPGV